MKIETIQVYDNLKDVDFKQKNNNDQIFIKKEDNNEYNYIDSFIVKNKYFNDNLIILNRLWQSDKEHCNVLLSTNKNKFVFSKNVFLNNSFLRMALDKEKKFIFSVSKYGNIQIQFYFESNGFNIKIGYKLIYNKNTKVFKTYKKLTLSNKDVSLTFDNKHSEFEDIVDFLMEHCNSKFKDEFIKYRKIVDYDVDDFILKNDEETLDLFKDILINKNILSLRTFESLFEPIYTTQDGIDIITSIKQPNKVVKVKDKAIYDGELNDDDKCLAIYLLKHKFGNEIYIKPKTGSIINNDNFSNKVEKVFKKKGYFVLRIKEWAKEEKHSCFKYYNGYWMEIPNDRDDSKKLLEEYQILSKLTD